MDSGINDGAMHEVKVLGGATQFSGDATMPAGEGIDTAKENESIKIYAEHHENLLHLLRRSGIDIASPCGGGGRCGKCLVRVVSSAADMLAPTLAELKFLPDELLSEGYRLACFLEVAGDLTISPAAPPAAKAKIITAGLGISLPLDPYMRKFAVDIKSQTLSEQVPDAELIAIALAGSFPEFINPGVGLTPNVYSDIQILKTLSGALSDGEGRVTCICSRSGGRIFGIEPGDTSGRCFGVAFDLGTTTIAGYLYDLSNGREIAVASMLNPQAKFGADVITRINYTLSGAGRQDEMRECALEGLNSLLARLTSLGGVASNEIYCAYLGGNTTMLHFFMGLPAGKIAAAPFIPVTTSLCYMTKQQSGLLIGESGIAACLPGVSAYVGADALAATLACNMDESDEISILIDIGTNGEIVIGGKASLYACSTAAGPAFEGASISCGMGGVDGAVDTVRIHPDGEIAYSTIGDAAPAGICGSGLVDAIAQLLKLGIIDETGRLLDADEAADEGSPSALCDRLVKLDGGARAFMLIPATDASAHAGIYISQRDIRELQNAKAAIAAGAMTLLSKAGLSAGDVSHVYLAGGFGNYINVKSAVEIGLVMRELEDRIIPAGNAAGAGVSSALLSGQAVGRLLAMSDKTRYIELSASAEFTQNYVDCMIFE